MNGLTIMKTSVPWSRWILQDLERHITWARMCFKASKSISMALKRGKVIEKFQFSIPGIAIPSIRVQTVKSLGKHCDSTLKYSAAILKASEEIGAWLAKVDIPDCPEHLKPGSTSIPSCPESCGLNSSMQSQ